MPIALCEIKPSRLRHLTLSIHGSGHIRVKSLAQKCFRGAESAPEVKLYASFSPCRTGQHVQRLLTNSTASTRFYILSDLWSFGKKRPRQRRGQFDREEVTSEHNVKGRNKDTVH